MFRTPEGTTFDGIGIPPDIEVPVFADGDVSAGRDPGFAKALRVLWAKQTRSAAIPGPKVEATSRDIVRAVDSRITGERETTQPGPGSWWLA